MLIRNVKSRQDLENRKKLQAEILQTQIDNEALLEQRVSDYKNPNKPPPVPVQYMTNSERLKDSLLQQKEAIENLRSLNLEFAIASQVVQDLGKLRDGEANVIKLNKNFPFIKKDLTEKLDVRSVDAQTIIDYLKEFFAEIDSAIGINLAGTSSTNFFDRGARAGQSFIPSSEDYLDLKALLVELVQNFDMNTDEIKQIGNRLKRLSAVSPTLQELDNIDTFDIIKRQRLNKQIQRLVMKPNYIPTKRFLEDIETKLRRFSQKGLTPVAQAGADAQGIPVGRDQPPQDLQFTLASLKKAIGIVGDRGIESLIGLKDAIGAEIQDTQAVQAGFKRVNVPVDYPDTNELLAEREALKTEREALKTERDEARGKIVADNKKYLKSTIFNLNLANAYERLVSPDTIDIYRSLYKNQLPTIDGGPELEDKSNIIYETFRNDSDGVKGKLRKGFFTDYKGVPIKGFTSDDLWQFMKKGTLIFKDGEISYDIETRYTRDKMRDMISKEEYPLMEFKLDNTPTYDPMHNPADRLIPSQGFGLTDKVVKHFEKDNKEMMKLNKSYKKHMKTEKEADEVDSSSEEEKRAKGIKGKTKTFAGRRIKLGRGVQTVDIPTYREFGKYIVHYPHLINDNILNLKYPSTGVIPQIRPVNIDDNFKDFFIDVLDSGKINQRHFESLTEPEKNHFVKIARGAKLADVLKIKKGDDEKEDMKRLELLFGEINAGNDNEKMIKECRELIKKYVANGVISRNKGLEMLLELN